MNPNYLWLTEAIELLSFLVLMQAIAIAIAYAAWRGKPQNASPKQYGTVCVASGVTASLLLVLASRMNADIRPCNISCNWPVCCLPFCYLVCPWVAASPCFYIF